MKLREFHGPERSVCPNLAKFGSYLATIWPHLVMKFFLVELGKKLRRCVGLILRVTLSKKMSYWTWQSANFCTFLVIARSNNSFF